MSWTPPVHTLLCPVPDASGKLIESITFRPFSHASHLAALERAGADEDDRYLELAQLATGLPVDVLEALKHPDYVTVAGMVNDWLWNTSVDFLGAVKYDADGKEIEAVNADGSVIPLLIPIETMGQKRDSLTLTMPALKATRMMKAQKNAADRTNFISAHCAGLLLDELGLLSVPDWNQLQQCVDRFLNRPAAFFQKTTSK